MRFLPFLALFISETVFIFVDLKFHVKCHSLQHTRSPDSLFIQFLFLFFLFLSFQSFVKHFEEVQRFEDVQVNCVHLIWSKFYGIFSHHSRITQELGRKFVVKVAITGLAVVASLSCILWQRLMLLCVSGMITSTWWLPFGRSLLSKTFLLCGHDI